MEKLYKYKERDFKVLVTLNTKKERSPDGRTWSEIEIKEDNISIFNIEIDNEELKVSILGIEKFISDYVDGPIKSKELLLLESFGFSEEK